MHKPLNYRGLSSQVWDIPSSHIVIWSIIIPYSIHTSIIIYLHLFTICYITQSLAQTQMLRPVGLQEPTVNLGLFFFNWPRPAGHSKKAEHVRSMTTQRSMTLLITIFHQGTLDLLQNHHVTFRRQLLVQWSDVVEARPDGDTNVCRVPPGSVLHRSISKLMADAKLHAPRRKLQVQPVQHVQMQIAGKLRTWWWKAAASFFS